MVKITTVRDARIWTESTFDDLAHGQGKNPKECAAYILKHMAMYGIWPNSYPGQTYKPEYGDEVVTRVAVSATILRTLTTLLFEEPKSADAFDMEKIPELYRPDTPPISITDADEWKTKAVNTVTHDPPPWTPWDRMAGIELINVHLTVRLRALEKEESSNAGVVIWHSFKMLEERVNECIATLDRQQNVPRLAP